MTGTQALVRLPMTQMRRDRESGLNTAAFISGYRGSPLGIYDQQLQRAKQYLEDQDVVFQTGLNEDLAATAVWGSQQVGLSDKPTKDGVVGLWYGKGPGVDRSGDVLKHANAAGTSKHGGVLAFAGDDHTCKSSSIPHQSDHAFISALMPMLYPSSVHEFIELGLLGIAMSRFSGCWVGYKVISETVETSSVIDLSQENQKILLPDDFEMPGGGLNIRWPDTPLVQDERLQEYKGYAAIAFARANGIDQTVVNTSKARLGIVASGKAYEDVCQALSELDISDSELEAIGIRIYKVRMPWPLEPVGIRQFSEGLEEVLIIEERREIIENQIKQQLFNWRSDVRPRIVGKFDENDRPFLPLSKALSVTSIAKAITERVLRLEMPGDLAGKLKSKLTRLENLQKRHEQYASPVVRLPHYCAGCPHNTSTRVPEGSKAMAGIGCHFMAQWMDRNTETFTHMGAEGVPWTAISRYSEETHRFVNLGDGTYFHSGSLAIRQSVSAGANITYKILYNDAVAMTGGQSVDGILSPEQVSHQLYQERVNQIYLLTDKPDLYSSSELAPGTVLLHRDHIDEVMLKLRKVEGTTAIIYEQTCAAELRRRRKKGLAEDPDQRVFINSAVCEGCGDCSEQSNCVAIDPVETEWGRKRKINQSTCNKDFSCLKGFCPSFVTIKGGGLKKKTGQATADVSQLPDPEIPSITRPWNIAVTGVGGTGILTIGGVLGMAAHLEGKIPTVMDMAGLAQKGGAVLSHIKISNPDNPALAPRISQGSADLLLAADGVVASSSEGLSLCDDVKTHAVLNTRVTPVSNFVRERDFDFKQSSVEEAIAASVTSQEHFYDFSTVARSLSGDEISANIMMVGYAWQSGLVPLQLASIHEAIALNGVAIDASINAFNWGRVLSHEPELVLKSAQPNDKSVAMSDLSLNELIEHRKLHLEKYQNAKFGRKYESMIQQLQKAADWLSDKSIAEKMVRAAAHNYAKVLAYKDEYEVARLYSDPVFMETLKNQFDGDYKLLFNLAPPFLPGKAPNGRPKKREFGASTLSLFSVLAKAKFLRGTLVDVFGYSKERKAERALIKIYEQDLQAVLENLVDDNAVAAIELLSRVDQVRGFGPVKEKALAEFHSDRGALLVNFYAKPGISN